MYAFTVILLGFVHSYCPAQGKTVSGVFQSHIAMENSGQYITRFLYHGGWLGFTLSFWGHSINIIYAELSLSRYVISSLSHFAGGASGPLGDNGALYM